MDAEHVTIAFAQSIPSLPADQVVTLGFLGALIGAIGLAIKVKGWIENSGLKAAKSIAERLDKDMGDLRNQVQSAQSEARLVAERQTAFERYVTTQFVSSDRFEAFEQRVDRRLDTFQSELTESRKERDRKLDNLATKIDRILERFTGSHG